MIIVKFCSGIGNQLYQYAVYKMLQLRYPEQEVLADVSVFEDIDRLNAGNGFSYGFALDDIFRLQVKKASREQIDRVSYEIYFNETWRKVLSEKFCQKYAGASRLAGLRARLSKKYRKMREHYVTAYPFNAFIGDLCFLKPEEDYYVSGLWQNYNYFSGIEKELRKDLIFSKELSDDGKRIKEQIDSAHSVCIHVRRGDFTSDRYKETHDICGASYYKKAMDVIRSKVENPVFYVFSDDVEECRKLFYEEEQVIYVSDGQRLRVDEEMRLMASCESAIIANSTFAFWNVWISDHPQKLVCYPRYIVREPYCWHEFSVPAHWIAVDNLIESEVMNLYE